jgi:hypothetical protein
MGLATHSEAKPFGFSAGCDSCNSRLLLLSNNASPHRFAFPLAGHDARKHRDEDVGYTLRHHSSQAENTLRVETRACGKVCGKVCPLKTLNKITKALTAQAKL